jgi:phosphoacetylglucosamine mutase
MRPLASCSLQDWEAASTHVCCADQESEVADRLRELLVHSGVQLLAAPQAPEQPPSASPLIILGCDTRPSAAGLVAAATAGVEAFGGHVLELGKVSTPQLHFAVVAANGLAAGDNPVADSLLNSYFSTLLDGFEELVASFGASNTTAPTLHVDCANGVGAAQLQLAATRLEAAELLKMRLINTGCAPGSLNNQCGADYVQKEVKAPQGFGDGVEPESRFVSGCEWVCWQI